MIMTADVKREKDINNRGAVSAEEARSAYNELDMLTIETIREYRDFLRTRPYWDGLVKLSGELNNPFMSFDWFSDWWAMFGKRARMLVLVLKQDGDPVAAIPMMTRLAFWRFLPVPAVSWIANDQTVRVGIAGDDEGVRDSLAVALKHFYDKRIRYGMLWLDQMPEGSPAVEQLDRILPEFGMGFRKMEGMQSPYITIGGDWDAYLAGRSRNLREKLKRVEKNFARSGKRELLTVSKPEEVDSAMKQITAVSRRTWKYRNKTAIANDPAKIEFYRRFAAHAAEQGMLKILLLRYEGAPIAFTYELKHGTKDYFLKTGFDERYSSLSPGISILASSIREAFSSGCSEYDLLGANEEYKMRFTGSVRPHLKYRAFAAGAYGRMLHAVETQAIPLIKGMAGKLGNGGLKRLPAHSPRGDL